MNIAIDLIGTSLESGTKTYNISFLKQLLKSNQNDRIYVFLCSNYLKYIDQDNLPKNILLKKKTNFFKIDLIKIIWMQLILPFELKLLNVNRVFSPMNYCPFICKILKIKIILGIHSNLPWVYFNKMPGSKVKNYFRKIFMELSIKFCNKLIVNSNFAKKEIIDFLKIEEKKIQVVYLGADNQNEIEKLDNDNLKNFNYNFDYILCVSSFVRYHNFINILDSFKQIVDKDKKNIKLIFVSQILDENYFLEIKTFVSKNFNEDKVIFLENLDKEFLKKLYKNALFYIFSSYCEVFGLTTLEAMSNSCPVLVSKTSALPEINSDSALYFDPDNQNEIRNKMLDLINNFDLRQSFKDKGLNHVKNFQWSKTFDETIEIILN
tara:strand:- start:760 stop:1893 length:1134 start_codon:yes stop_codon:yes gene_type:complete